jgi:general nucleoside transport system permease protein
MRVIRNILIVMLVSGAFAGLSGMVQLTEVARRYSPRMSANYGWMGINVAILAGNDPLGLIPWGVFLAMILFSGTILKAQGISYQVVIALTGLILFLVSIGEVVANYRFINIAKLEKEVERELLGLED